MQEILGKDTIIWFFKCVRRHICVSNVPSFPQSPSKFFTTSLHTTEASIYSIYQCQLTLCGCKHHNSQLRQGKFKPRQCTTGKVFKPTETICQKYYLKAPICQWTQSTYLLLWLHGPNHLQRHLLKWKQQKCSESFLGSCQNALLLHICNRLGLEHSASKWGCTIRTDRDRSNQEICQKTTPWLDHTDPVLYQLRILYPAAADGMAAIMALQGSNGGRGWDQMTATSALMTALHFCMRPKRRCNNCYSWI